MWFLGGVVALHKGSCLYFSIELNCFVFPWFSIFSYPLLRMFTLYWVVFVNTWQKGGDLNEMWESCLFCLGGDTLIVYDSGKYKYVWQIQVCFDVFNLAGELVCIFVVFLFFCYFSYICLCVLFSVSRNIQVDSIELLSTLAIDR